MEEYAYVLDVIPYGDAKTGGTLVKLIGESNFTLLDAVLKRGKEASVGERLYIGKDIEKREKVAKIRGRIRFDRLTSTAKENLLNVVKKIVISREKEFINFLNKAGPINIRTHQLDFIPGIGKRNMELLLKEREKKPFESFEDVKKRVPTWLDPVSSFATRIINELEGKEKHYFFVMPFIRRRY